MFTLIKGNENQVPKDIDPKNNICVVKTDIQGNKEWFYGANIVTNDGDIYLRALMHDDGNIRYANYQNQDQMREYITSQGHESVIAEIV